MKTLFFAVVVVWGNWAFSFPVPQFTQPVIDQAGMIRSQTLRTLNQELSSIYQSGGPQIVVLTIPSLENQTIEERAIQVFDQWQIGKTGKDNGVLLLIAKKEKKIRIEVGYGLEGDIPDAYAKRIIEDLMLPLFRKGQFDQGVVVGIQQIAQLSQVQIKNISALSVKNPPVTLPIEMKGLLLFLLILFLRAKTGRSRYGLHRGRSPHDIWWGGGGPWSGGGGFGGWGGGGGRSGGGGASGGW